MIMKKDKILVSILELNRVSIKIFLLALLFISSVIYILSVNFLSTRGFEIKRLQRELSRVKKANLEISFELNSLSSADNVLRNVKNLGLEPIKNQEYLIVSQKNIAVSK